MHFNGNIIYNGYGHHLMALNFTFLESFIGLRMDGDCIYINLSELSLET